MGSLFTVADQPESRLRPLLDSSMTFPGPVTPADSRWFPRQSRAASGTRRVSKRADCGIHAAAERSDSQQVDARGQVNLLTVSGQLCDVLGAAHPPLDNSLSRPGDRVSDCVWRPGNVAAADHRSHTRRRGGEGIPAIRASPGRSHSPRLAGRSRFPNPLCSAKSSSRWQLGGQQVRPENLPGDALCCYPRFKVLPDLLARTM